MNNMTELYEIYSYPYEEEDEYHTFLIDMKFPFFYTNQARDGASSGDRFTARPNAIRKLRDFFFCRRASREDDEEVDEEQETLIEKFLRGSETEKPRGASLANNVSATRMDVCEKLDRRQEQQKTVKAVGKVLKKNEVVKMKSPGRANLRKENWHYQQFNNDEGVSTITNGESALPNPLPKSALKRKRGTEKTEANNAGFHTYMKHLRAQQCAIHEGKLEQVIRPGYAPPRNTMTRPPPPIKSQSPTLQSTPKRHKDKSPASKIAPSKLTSYMTSSADLLDATRRDLTSNLLKSVEKLRPPLAGLDLHYVGILRRGNATDEDDDDDDDDDQSFSCIGISETELRVSTPELEKARRLSGDGTDPWTQTRDSRAECRMCHGCRPSAGLRGLCRECENAFQRSMKSFNRLGQDEVKPPVPLKTTKNKAEKRISSFREELRPSPTSSNDSERFVDHSASRTSAELGKAPSIVSQHGRIEGNSYTPQRRTEFISIYERWQTLEMRAELAKREGLRWSSSLLGREDTPTTMTVKPSLRSKFSTS
jgi:hypothetical protein